jgi:hypothetical protein
MAALGAAPALGDNWLGLTPVEFAARAYVRSGARVPCA